MLLVASTREASRRDFSVQQRADRQSNSRRRRARVYVCAGETKMTKEQERTIASHYFLLSLSLSLFVIVVVAVVVVVVSDCFKFVRICVDFYW